MVAKATPPAIHSAVQAAPERAAGADTIVYPDSDGQPMSDNTRQFARVVLIKENLDRLRDDFVAGDLLWYPVEGNPKVRMAPDVLVAVGRKKGDRGSFKSWLEDGPPTVVFEVLPSIDSRAGLKPAPTGSFQYEMVRKAAFYLSHGVREFVIIDPENETGWALLYDRGELQADVPDLDGWTSPTLGIRFEKRDGALFIIGPDGRPFETLEEASTRADEERRRADEEKLRADEEKQRAERLAAKLRELGVDPEA